MSDNVQVTAGTGTTIAADDVGGVLFQRVKLGLGADGTAVDAVAGEGVSGTAVQRVVLASDGAVTGGVTETAPATDTASSGLNGRLQRIAQRLTSLIALIPAALGQTTKSASMSVTIASDQGEIGKAYSGIFNVNAPAMTRPANTTAYTALDSISDNATAGSVTANSVSLSDTNDVPIDIAEILLVSTDTGPGTAGIQIRLHVFNSDPTASTGVVGGDNAAWSNKQAGWVGSFSGTMRSFSDGSCGVLVPDEGSLRICNPVSGAKTLFWQLQTLGAFTPSANSTTFTPRFKGFQGRVA
jgi:hypothetical protein